MAAPALEAEIRVMLATERRVLRQLSMAYSNISKDLTALERKAGPGAMLQRAQLRQVRAVIKGEMAGMWSRVGNEIRAGRIQAAGAAVGLASEAEKLFRAAGLTSTEIATMQRSMTLAAESSVDAAMRRMQGDSYRPLSDKVYHTQVLVNGQLDRVINQAMLKEANAASLSKAVRGFIRPDTAGGVRYASNRLARTEINNAFHASAVKGMQSEPFTKNVLWNLSGSHARPDVCNDYAEEPHVLGGEAGVWSPMEVPERPHPNCLCFVTAITMGDEEFIQSFIKGDFDEWLKDEIGYEPSPLDVKTVRTVTNPLPATLKQFKGLSRATNGSLDGYKNTDYPFVNGYLRGNPVSRDWRRPEIGEEQLRREWKQQIDDIDDLIRTKGTPLEKDTIFYRGERSIRGEFDPEKVYVPGEYVVNAGYTSTSSTKKIQDRFSDIFSGREKGYKIDVVVPKGTRVVVGTEGEFEVILPRNARFKVKSNRDNHIVLHMEVDE